MSLIRWELVWLKRRWLPEWRWLKVMMRRSIDCRTTLKMMTKWPVKIEFRSGESKLFTWPKPMICENRPRWLLGERLYLSVAVADLRQVRQNRFEFFKWRVISCCSAGKRNQFERWARWLIGEWSIHHRWHNYYWCSAVKWQGELETFKTTRATVRINRSGFCWNLADSNRRFWDFFPRSIGCTASTTHRNWIAWIVLEVLLFQSADND